MAFSVSVRDAAAKTISSTDSPEAASEEAAAEPATEETELLEPPQAVRAADADAMPAAHRKLRREIMVFIVLLLTMGICCIFIFTSGTKSSTAAVKRVYLRAHSPSSPAAMRTPCSRLGRMYSRFSFTALGLPGRLTMRVLPRSTLAARLSIPRGVMLRLW